MILKIFLFSILKFLYYFSFFSNFFLQYLIVRYQDVIVFIVGGGCYSEFYNLQVRKHVRVSVLTSFSTSYLSDYLIFLLDSSLILSKSQLNARFLTFLGQK